MCADRGHAMHFRATQSEIHAAANILRAPVMHAVVACRVTRAGKVAARILRAVDDMPLVEMGMHIRQSRPDMAAGEIASDPVSAGRQQNDSNVWVTGGGETGVYVVQAESGRLLVLDGPGGQAFELPAPESGRAAYAAGDAYRLQLWALPAGVAGLQALVEQLRRLPHCLGAADARLSFGSNLQCRGVFQPHSDARGESFTPSPVYDVTDFELERAFWQRQSRARLRLLFDRRAAERHIDLSQ